MGILDGLDELARRFDRSVSWVSRRLALMGLVPEAIQQQVREGKILAQVALKFLVPVVRQSLEDCQRLSAIFAEHQCDTRARANCMPPGAKGRARSANACWMSRSCFFKAQWQEAKPATTAAAELRDLEMVTAMVNRAQRRLAGGAATELDHQPREEARQHIDRIEKQLQRIDEKLLPEQETHVEPSATHHDSGTECGCRSCSARRKPNLAGNRSWSFSISARGTSRESMRS